MLRDDVLNGYFAVLLKPSSWLVIVLWNLVFGSIIYMISQIIRSNKFEIKHFALFTARFTGCAFGVEIVKSIIYIIIEVFTAFKLNVWTSNNVLYDFDQFEIVNDRLTHLGDLLFSISYVLLSVGFVFLIYFFVLRKYNASKKHRIVLSIILSLISGAYFVLYW